MKFKIWLIMLKINNKEKLNLLSLFKSEEEIYNNFELWLNKNPILYKRFVDYNKINGLERAEILLEWLIENKIGFIDICNPLYPNELREIEEPPYGLFYKGNISVLNNRKVSIVGSRVCTNYGIEVTKLLTKELISYNISIISGGAKGIDSVAHRTSVELKGSTVVVLGCGIDVVYPAQNRALFDKVLDNGVIISEFLPGTAPFNYNFPRRNRIISGLSELVIVIEASDKSGSLITASYAANQGREVMAIPGSIFSKGSNGCNKLIRDGAIIFTGLEDLYATLNLELQKEKRIISPIKQRILSLVQNEPIHIDDIISKAKIDREALFNVLFEMQIGKEIISLPGNYYAKIT